MSPGKRRGILIGGALLVVVLVVAAFFVLNSGNSAPTAEAGATSVERPGAADPQSAITEYVQDLTENNPDAAARLTDDNAAAAVALRDTRNTLNPKSVVAKLTLLQPTPAGAKTTGGTFSMAWSLKGGVWSYDVPFQLAQAGGKWLVHWAPSLLHPKLEAGQRLVVSTAATDTTAVADRDGKPLLIAGAGGTRAAEGNPAPLL
ncbi:NTF2-like N-terminal transpeptidase domain-containing protein, partial [Amycolatopsis sp. SID8362]|uniref:NTF2-like N-terminal transpeptidase domain-containing protein n=1 Tax=Amycolatopsis sp. SID8362 TaxID=2690346 RepID=UPI00142A3801